MENLFNTLFYPTTYIKKGGFDRNITDGDGKHYMEKHLQTYISREDFSNFMEETGRKKRQIDGRYYFRPKKQYILKYS